MLALPLNLLKKWEKVLEIVVFDNPTVVWRPSPGNPANCQKVASLGYIFTADSIGLSLFKFSSWAPKTHVLWNRVSIGRSMSSNWSLILAPTESAYADSYWSSIVTLVVSCPVSEILQVFSFLLKTAPHPYYTQILGCFPWTTLTMFDLRGTARIDVPKLIIRVITFKVTQHIRPRYINVTDRVTDRRTDGWLLR